MLRVGRGDLLSDCVSAFTFSIDRRYCGPPTSANGGYASGLLAAALLGEPPFGPGRPGAAAGSGSAPVEVALRLPPPLEQPLVAIVADDGTAELHDGDAVVATARRLDSLDIAVPAAVSVEAARAVEAESPIVRDLDAHPFPTCFVCGTARAVGDGLRIFPARIPGTDVFAAAYTPAARETGIELVWAALDSPSSFPMYLDEDPFPGPIVLGRMAVRIDRTVEGGRPHVVMAWREGVDGRKLHTAGALLDDEGTTVAVTRATWIRLRAQ